MPSEKPKEKLISAAIRLFSEKGYHGTSVNDLAQAAQVNVALVSYHFGGKEGLLVEVLAQISHEKIQAAQHTLGQCESAADFRRRLEQFLNGMVDFYMDQQPLLKLFFQELEQGFEGAEAAYAVAYPGLIESLQKFLSEGVRLGYMRPTEDVRAVMLQMLSPLNSLVRSDKSTAKFLKVSLTDPSFRDILVRDIVRNVAGGASPV